jgi:hypothetical protein
MRLTPKRSSAIIRCAHAIPTTRANIIIRSNPIIVPTAAASSIRTVGEATISGVSRETAMIRKLAAGKYRLYSRRKNPRTGKRRNLGTFSTKKAAQQHERQVQYFKRH